MRLLGRGFACLALIAGIGAGCSDKNSDGVPDTLQRAFGHQLGVEVDGGKVRLAVPSCFPDPILHLFVMADGREVWRIDSEDAAGTRLKAVTVGQVPNGFAEVKPLSASLVDAERIDIGAFGPGLNVARARFTVDGVKDKPLPASCHAG